MCSARSVQSFLTSARLEGPEQHVTCHGADEGILTLSPNVFHNKHIHQRSLLNPGGSATQSVEKTAPMKHEWAALHIGRKADCGMCSSVCAPLQFSTFFPLSR